MGGGRVGARDGAGLHAHEGVAGAHVLADRLAGDVALQCVAQVADAADPYYSDAALFDSVLSTIERASIALFRQLEPVLRQGVS